MTAEHVILILRTFYTFRRKTAKTKARELAAKLGVSERSIFRYINQIEIAGIPIEHKSGAHGGFTLLKGGADE
ncbi:MAG: HTH domain-containing protein [Clostridia bacterium]|jgi:predicted DNA-binding transcriptional regulator YafY|nr:HTH domain-containing protein [Clostridia bacterium]